MPFNIQNCNSSPAWITPEIKLLIRKCQKAFVEKERYLVQQSCSPDRYAKRFYCKDRIQNLKTNDPCGWHKDIQMITNVKQQSPLIIYSWYLTER